MSRFFLPLIAACLSLTACNEMNDQPRYDSYERSELFADGKSLQSPPEGTVARDTIDRKTAFATRPDLTKALLERGRTRFGIYCEPCHDASGYGEGTIPARGFPKPPSFHIARLREVPARHIVNVITDGYGAMYSYADRVEPHDRWAIAAYIRALQLSQDALLSTLSADEKSMLEKAGPTR
jgi:mono/diheme cytochrome c family protein